MSEQEFFRTSLNIYLRSLPVFFHAYFLIASSFGWYETFNTAPFLIYSSNIWHLHETCRGDNTAVFSYLSKFLKLVDI